MKKKLFLSNNDKQKRTPTFAKNYRNCFMIFSIFIILSFTLNALIISSFTPSNIQQGETAELHKKFGTVSIYSTKNLKSGGIGLLSADTSGYVNLIEPNKNIYINEETIKTHYNGSMNQTAFLYKHEIAHIEQKEIIADKAGGYPKWTDPIKTVKYIYYLFKLNNDYQKLMPKIHQKGFVVFKGLESAADCRSTQPELNENTSDSYTGRYIGSQICTNKQRDIVYSAISGKWPKDIS